MKKLISILLLFVIVISTYSLNAYCSSNIKTDVDLSLEYTPAIDREVIITTTVKNSKKDFEKSVSYNNKDVLLLNHETLSLYEIQFKKGNSTVDIDISITNNLNEDGIKLVSTPIYVTSKDVECKPSGDWTETITKTIEFTQTYTLDCTIKLTDYSGSNISFIYIIFLIVS